MKRADEAFKHHHYQDAITLYQQAIRKDLDNDRAITNMAIALWRTNQLLQAEYWFTRAALMNEDPEVKLMFSQVLIANEKYADAVNWLGKYLAVQTDDEKVHHAKQLQAWAKGLAAGAELSEDIRVVPAPINSDELDFAPFLHKGMLYFTTNRKGVMKRSGEYDPWTGGRFTDVFAAYRQDENTFEDPIPAPGIPATPAHEGPISFSADGREFFISTSDADERKRKYDASNNTTVTLRHYLRDNDGKWVQGRKLPFTSSDFNTTHPALSRDGQMLVFASDRPGGQGGMDLYYVMRLREGGWGNPVRLGDHINTRGNDVFPYLDEDDNLYFSSNWHPGFGGMDIFKCQRTDDGWGLPENLGRPINSARDDFGIVLDPDGNSGFFTSNRNPDTKDDILFFKKSIGIRIEGQLVDCATGEGILNARIELRGSDNFRDADFTDGEGYFSFLVSNEGDFELFAIHERYRADGGCTGKELCSTKGMTSGQRTAVRLAMTPLAPAEHQNNYLCGKITHASYGNPLRDAKVVLLDGEGNEKRVNTGATGSFYIPALAGEKYSLKIEREGFFSHEEALTLEPGIDQCHAISAPLTVDKTAIPEPLSADIRLEKGMVLELFHIYFDRALATIREDAIEDLQTFFALLERYPNMRGEIMAHTDTRADEQYNLELSQRRADAVKKYLTDRGIDPKRLDARGYGEAHPVNHCVDGVECSEEQHQRNRRVEFRIIQLDSNGEENDLTRN